MTYITLGGAPQSAGPYKGYAWVTQGATMLPVSTTVDGKPIAEGEEFDVILPDRPTRMRVTQMGALSGLGFPVYREAFPDQINITRFVVVASQGTPYETTYVFQGPSDDAGPWRDNALNHFAEECIANHVVYLSAATLGAALDADHLGRALQAPAARPGPRFIISTRIGDTKTEVYHLAQDAIDVDRLPQDLNYGWYVLLAAHVSLVDEAVAAGGHNHNRPVVHLVVLFLDSSVGVYRPIPLDTVEGMVPAVVTPSRLHGVDMDSPTKKLESVIATLMAPTVKD